MFAQHAGQSRKRERVCARRVVHAIGQLPVVLVDERVLARLERHLLQHAGSGKRPLSNELVRRAMRLTRKAVFRLQMQMKQVPKVGLSVKGPRRRLGVILYRRTGAVRELEAVYRCLPNTKVRAAVALICAGASEADVQ